MATPNQDLIDEARRDYVQKIAEAYGYQVERLSDGNVPLHCRFVLETDKFLTLPQMSLKKIESKVDEIFWFSAEIKGRE